MRTEGYFAGRGALAVLAIIIGAVTIYLSVRGPCGCQSSETCVNAVEVR